SLEAMKKAMRGEVEPPESAAPPGRPIPAELSALCARALAKDPADRVPTARDFLAALKDYLSGSSRKRESRQLAESARREFQQLRQAESRGASAREIYARHNAVADQAQ